MKWELKKPILKKKNAARECDHNALGYAVASMQGWRKTMEDSHRVSLSLPGQLKDHAFAGVFDGHGGKQVAAYTSKYLLKRILRRLPLPQSDANVNGSTQNANEVQRQNQIKGAINESFLKLDDTMRWSKKIDDDSGTTAVCVLVTPTHFYFANCGDSRAILCRDGKIGFATIDHKPYVKSEKKRIEAAGGSVRRKRVNGCLALSRALGDFEYKRNAHKGQSDQMVSPQPDITVIERNNVTDEFIVLACDGVYDVMSNFQLISYIKHQMTKTKDLRTICNNVVDHCLRKGSRDNISIVLLTLPGCPKQEELLRKRKLDFMHMNRALHSKNAKVPRDGPQLINQAASANNKNNPPQIPKAAYSGTPQHGNQAGNVCLQQRNHGVTPNAFIIYFLEYWKRNGGNICKAAKVCGEAWTGLTRPEKRKYQRRYLYKRRRGQCKSVKPLSPSS